MTLDYAAMKPLLLSRIHINTLHPTASWLPTASGPDRQVLADTALSAMFCLALILASEDRKKGETCQRRVQ